MKKKPTGIGISNVFIKMLNGDYLDKIPSYDGWKKTSESRRRIRLQKFVQSRDKISALRNAKKCTRLNMELFAQIMLT